MKRTSLGIGIAASIAMGILILDSRTALAGAAEGIELCIQSLIPSLLPFFVLSSLLTGAFAGSSPRVLRPIAAAIHVPSGCEALLIPAFLGGYPAGAQCIGQACQSGSLSKAAGQRLLLFCNNPGPSFLFGVLGMVFPEKRILWALWGIQIAGAILWAWILPGGKDEGSLPVGKGVSITESLTNSVRILAAVCGWVILFRVMISFLQRWALWCFPLPVQILITGLLELSNGCCSLNAIGDIRLRFLISAVMLSFGGMCVALQTASVVPGLAIRPYIVSKVFQSLLCLCLSAGLMYRKPVFFLIVLLFCVSAKKIVAIRATMVYNDARNSRRMPYAVSKKGRTRLRILPSRHPAGGWTDPLRQKRTARSR